MSDEAPLVAYSAREKLTLLLLAGVALIAAAIWMICRPAPDLSCLWHIDPFCGPRPIRRITEHWIGWLGAVFFTVGLAKIVAMHVSGAPFMSLDADGIRCRGWGHALAWAEIKAVRSFTTGSWRAPNSLRTRELQLEIEPQERFPSLRQRIGGYLTYLVRNHNPVTGKYRVVLSFLDQHPDAVKVEIRARLDPHTRWDES